MGFKEGLRKSGPTGNYDGTYNEDYYYIGNNNELDECNGGLLNGKYVYFITKITQKFLVVYTVK